MMRPLGVFGIALAGLVGIFLFRRVKGATGGWQYSDVSASIEGAFLILNATITNNSNELIIRDVSIWWDGNKGYTKSVALAADQSRAVTFSLQLWAPPPEGTALKVWLEDDEGGKSSKVRAVA